MPQTAEAYAEGTERRRAVERKTETGRIGEPEKFIQRGYVVKQEGEYHVGLRFFALGMTVRGRHPVYDIAKLEVRTLAEETGEFANFMIEELRKGVYVHRETDEEVG